ncbi:hypothetical protein Theco_2382 [Thermobacillus composti KWC4]|uniref:Uncharacterized protein n=1 Tax=Thermobacillus composti (strain DSM 18247 / JCM 13945 / KWC4) TaxID=717605 RepID=L0EH57_THECK|nr:hypothetical protein [Thermobacillus composti]AGA58490.1 hypothetical protein Theco_2382 [Thermobacillus composti KWC4]
MDDKTTHGDELDRETTGRRGWYAPVVSVLLVLSLIGNVYLYTLVLQDGRDRREAEGHQLAGDLTAAAVSLASASRTLDQLMLAQGADRVRIKVELEGDLSAGLPAVARLIGAAAGKPAGSQVKAIEEAALSGLQAAYAKLRELGAHTEPLSEAELRELDGLKALLGSLASSADSVHVPDDLTDMAAMQLAAGGRWIDAAAEAAQALKDWADG